MLDLRRIISEGVEASSKQWPMLGGGKLDRSKYVTASEIGSCARMIKLNKEHGQPSSLGQWGFAERGNAVEAWAVRQLHAAWRNEDCKLVYTGDNQVSFALDNQSGTPDGLFVWANHNVVDVLEIKSFDPRKNISAYPVGRHEDQVTQNLDLASALLDMSPGRGYLIYINASDYQDQYLFPIDYDMHRAEQLEKRAEHIMGADASGLEPEGIHTGDCKYCPHTAECSRLIAAQRNGDMRNGEEERKEAARKLFR